MEYPQAPVPTFLFDLDGTLIDSVYQHVIAWRAALEDIGIDLSVWRIHRRIGMSGGLFVQGLLRETGRSLSAQEIARLQEAHAVEYRKQLGSVTALPGARELLAALTDAGVRWAIATSGYALTARPALELLGLPEDTPMVTRDLVRHAKPDPDLFLAAAALLGVEPQHAMVVGDSVWDLLAARRAGSLGIGLQSGGYGREELERAGAYRVYADPAEMLSRVDEIGVRLDENAAGLPTLPRGTDLSSERTGGYDPSVRLAPRSAPTSLEQNKAVVVRFLEEAFNRGNLAVIAELVAADIVYHTPDGGAVRGHQGVSELVTGMRTAFPDLEATPTM